MFAEVNIVQRPVRRSQSHPRFGANVPLVVVIVQDFGHHVGRNGEFLYDIFIARSPVFGGVEWPVLDEVPDRNRVLVALQSPDEDDKVVRLHPSLVVATVGAIVFRECRGDGIISSVGGSWEDGSAVAHVVRVV